MGRLVAGWVVDWLVGAWENRWGVDKSVGVRVGVDE